MRRLVACAVTASAALLAVATPSAGDPGAVVPRVTVPDALLPDLQVEPLSDFHVQILEGRRVVRFTVSISNRGDGPLEVIASRTSTSTPEMAVVQRIGQRDGGYEPVRTDAVMTYASDDGHTHWHLLDAAEYTLEAPGEDEPRVAHKEGFCLVDGTALEGTPDPDGEYHSCAEGLADSRSAREGISVGWSDPYPFNVWGQWIDLTGLPLPGRYCVTATADPLHHLVEKDRDNNSASALLDLTSNGVTAVGTGC